jgi:hypothetical protein
MDGFTIDSDSCFRADNGANSAAGAALGDQFGRMITFSGYAFLVESQHVLRAFCHACLTPFTIHFTDDNPSLEGHSFLLFEYK